MVTYHPEYHVFDPHMAVASLAAIVRLGIGWVRTDVRWREILPDGRQPDHGTLAWYRTFLGAASECGLKTMVVLSTPPEAVMRQERAEKLDSWCGFVETVASEFGTLCNCFQLMNEPNNPVYRFFPLEDVAAAFVRGAPIIRSFNPEAKVGINVALELWGWRRYLVDVLQRSGRSIDIIGLDHFPGTWTVGWQNRWADVTEIADIIAAAPRDSPWFDRRLAIMETGFSTNAIMRDQKRQSEYFENVMNIAKNLRRKAVGHGTLFGIYELCDGDSSAWLDPEAHFGLLTSDLKPKKAYATVKEIVASL
jgi:hypothetical protein